MKKLSYLGILVAICTAQVACANYDDKRFQAEVLEGLDLISVKRNIDTPVAAPGELGGEVYQTVGAADTDGMRVFVDAPMYLRLGGGVNLGFATDAAEFNGAEYDAKDGYSTQIGLGWNLSSYVRAELDFQQTTLKFADLGHAQATYYNAGGMLYFDFARRYILTGDVTQRRALVPFMGIGAGVGTYEFQGADGADGFVIAAPRAAFGVNVKLNDLVGVDVMYQYQMMIGNGFGWNVTDNSVNSISNIMVSLRAEF